MKPNNLVTDTAIDAQHASQAIVNSELAAIMEQSLGDPIVAYNGKFAHHAKSLEQVLGDESDPRAQALRDAMLVAVHVYALHANDEMGDETRDATEKQSDRFHFNRAMEIYEPVYVDMRNALQALQEPGFHDSLQPRLAKLFDTLGKMAKKNGSFSDDLLAQARITAAANKGVGIV